MELARDNFIGKMMFSKFLITKKLGEGSFGRIYKAVDGEVEYAFKIEKKRHMHSLLKNEANMMKELAGRI